MTVREEDVLRTAFAALVPDAPPMIGDPAPVVRRARQRRVRTVAATGVACLGIAAAAIPFLLPGGGGGDDVAVEPVDAFTEVPCDTQAAQESGFDPAQVVSARLCDVSPVPDFHVAAPPRDALVTGLGGWREDLAGIDAADPGRCAAVDVLTVPMRLLVKYADGSARFVDATMCGDVVIGGTRVDGADVTTAFLDALAAQRAELGPPATPPATEVDCGAAGTLAVPLTTLAPPVAAVQCPESGRGKVRPMGPDQLASLTTSYASGTRGGDETACGRADVGWFLGTVDAYGDVVHWGVSDCAQELVMISGSRTQAQTWTVPLDFSDN